MKLRKFVSILIVISMLSSLFGVNAFSLESQTIEYEPKQFSNASIDQDFCDSSVLVVMDKSVGAPNRGYSANFFGGLPIAEIIDLTKIDANMINLEAARQDGETAGIKEIVNKQIAANKNNEDFRQILQIKLQTESKESVLEAIKVLEQIDGIVSASPDYKGTPALIPNDPLYDTLWGMPQINAPSAWDITTGNSEVRVGILDTGISPHVDLNANLRADLGWNFINNNSDTSDYETHGTHVAGTVGAVGDNGEGVVGVAWNVTLVPLKFNGYTSQISQAFTLANANNIPIVNMSWQGWGNDPVFEQAIRNYNGLFVVAAGNYGRDLDISPNYPPNFRLDNMISVGASTNDDNIAYFSCWGAKTVHLFAPGVNINSTIPGGYSSYQGTSMAAPHVAGVAALLLSVVPEATTEQLKQAILEGVDEVNALSGKCITGGRLNARQAIENIVDIVVPPVTFDVNYQVLNDWTIGNVRYQNVQITLTNTGTETIRNWALQYDPCGTITSIWNAQVYSADIVKNAMYNSDIPSGQAVTFGYTLVNATGEKPTKFTMPFSRVVKQGGYTTAIDVLNEWVGGFTGMITITNTTNEPIMAWELSFDAVNFSITETGQFVILENVGNNYKLTGRYNGNIPIPANTSITLQFNGVKTGTPALSNVTLTEMALVL